MQRIVVKARWRYRLSRRLLPYHRAIVAISLIVTALSLGDTFLGWGILRLSSRKAEGLALAAGLVCYVILAPDLHLQTLSRVWRRQAARDHSRRL